MSAIPILSKNKIIKEEKKIINQPIQIHRAGYKPEYQEDDDSDQDDIFENNEKTEKTVKIRKPMEKMDDIRVSVNKRTKKLSKTKKDNELGQIQNRLNQRRQICQSQIIEELENENVNDAKVTNKDDTTFKSTQSESREEMKRRILLEQSNQESKPEEDDNELLELLGNNEEAEEKNKIKEEENNLEEDEEEEEEEEALMRPVFVTKENRLTIQEQEQAIQKEQEEMQRFQEQMKKERQKGTKDLLIKYIQEEEKQAEVQEETMPDDTDIPGDLVEYENWKIRELKRIKQQAEEDEKKISEKIEIERRRNLTNEQRKLENLKLGSDATLKPFKSKYAFMQQYYHKGAFFVDQAQGNAEHILNRDYNLPTAEDKVDKSLLPTNLQKRRGVLHKKGQSKYTHLTAEDTTNFDRDTRVNEFIANRLQNSLAGFKSKDDFTLTGRKRK
jgi:microfibrillar-associated protein 1